MQQVSAGSHIRVRVLEGHDSDRLHLAVLLVSMFIRSMITQQTQQMASM